MQDGSVSPVKAFFHNKWVILALVFDAILIIFIIALIAMDSNKKTIITFNVVPNNAQISVNGKDGYSNGSYRFMPGTYEVLVSYPGLASKAFTLDLTQNDIGSITTYLHQDGNFDYYKLRENLGDFSALSEIATAGYNQTTDYDVSAEKFISDFQKNFELFSTELPIIYSEYNNDGKLTKYVSVVANYECSTTLCLKASISNEDDKALISSLLLGAGFDMEDFEIEY